MYMRAPVGSNADGGKQIQIINPGSRGNEFRLGNESAYGEIYLTAHVLKPENDSAAYFDANVTFMYNPPMNSQYSDTSNDRGDNIQVIQAFAKGGRFDGSPLSFWAGKRFYRNVDFFMNDFFYFANMSGNGGGVEDIATLNGRLSIAWLQHTARDIKNGSNGSPTKQAIDIRLLDYSLDDKNKLHFWFASAWNTSGNGESTTALTAPVQYKARTGTASGIRWQYGDHQNLAIMYGTGIMESLEMDNTAISPVGTPVNALERLRLTEHFVYELNPRWTLHGGAIAEIADSRRGTDSRSYWYNVGLRPLYRFTDHYHLAMGAGYSVVGSESERDLNGKRFGDRTLFRATIAPEVGLGSGFFDRPVVRAYATYSQWNNANRNSANSNSIKSVLNSQNIRALDGSSDFFQFGVEAEIWF